MLFVPSPTFAAFASRRGVVALVVRAKAQEIADRAASTVRVLTGETAASGRVSLTADGARVSFGGAARYLEFGAYGRRYPFLRPAADAVVPGGRRG